MNIQVVTYESVTSRLPRLAIGDDHSLLDVSEHLEIFPEAGVGRVIRKTSHKDLGESGVFLRRVHRERTRKSDFVGSCTVR